MVVNLSLAAVVSNSGGYADWTVDLTWSECISHHSLKVLFFSPLNSKYFGSSESLDVEVKMAGYFPKT